MGLFDAFRYDGKRVLVVGGATGMGAAGAELALDAGAAEEVVVLGLDVGKTGHIAFEHREEMPFDVAFRIEPDSGSP